MKHVPISHSLMTMHLTDKIIFAMDIIQNTNQWHFIDLKILGSHHHSHSFIQVSILIILKIAEQESIVHSGIPLRYHALLSNHSNLLGWHAHNKRRGRFEKPEVPTIGNGSLNQATNEMTLHIMRTDSHHLTNVHTRVYPQIWILYQGNKRK